MEIQEVKTEIKEIVKECLEQRPPVEDQLFYLRKIQNGFLIGKSFSGKDTFYPTEQEAKNKLKEMIG